MGGELWRLQRAMRRILGRPSLRICSESERGLSLGQSGAWAAHIPGLVIVSDAVIGEPLLLASVVAHECAHEVLCPESVAAEDMSGLQPVLSRPWRSWPSHLGPSWAGHDARWIRAVCHVIHRMRGHGLATVPAAVANLQLYGLKSSLCDYVEALDGEPSQLDWVPICEALARPVPAEFESLWTADVRQSLGVELSKERVDHEHGIAGTSRGSGSRKSRGRRPGVGGVGRRRRR